MIDPYVGAAAQFSEALSAGRMPPFPAHAQAAVRLGLLYVDLGERWAAAVKQGDISGVSPLRGALHAEALRMAEWRAVVASSWAGFLASVGDGRAAIFAGYSADRQQRRDALRWLLQGTPGTAPQPIIDAVAADLRLLGLID